jgi:nicotinamidase-related amidase
MASALLVMDFINDIVHPDSPMAAKGYAQCVQEHDTITHLTTAIAKAKGMSIVFVRVAFEADYSDKPEHSPLFSKVDQFKVAQEGSWGTQFIDEIKHVQPDHVVTKNRVSPFYGTDLDGWLREHKIDTLYLCGVATDLVVESAAREAHDRDYKVNVLSDCCAAANTDEHEAALHTLAKIATVGTSKDLLY